MVFHLDVSDFTRGVLMCFSVYIFWMVKTYARNEREYDVFCRCFFPTHTHTQKILFDNVRFGWLNAYTIEGDVDFRSRRNLFG